jgi:apolipoprotein D and lipocalin family protein
MKKIMKPITALFFLTSVTLFSGCSGEQKPLPTVEKVEVQKYLGTWYEIARYDVVFEKDCGYVTANYKLKEDGDIKVTNSCTKLTTNEPDQSIGTAYATDETNTKLKVSFFWPFYGDYYVIDLAEDYSFALVGAPSREYLWILARTSTIDESVKERLLAKAQSLGFDTTKLLWTKQ